MELENQKKPYESPTLTVLEIENKFNLLCGSGCEEDEFEEEFSGIPVIIGKKG